MQRANRVTSIITFSVALALIWGASGMDYRVEFSPAAGFFPLWLGIALAILSLVLFFQNTIGTRKSGKEDFFPGNEAKKRILLYSGALTLCIFAIGKLGFLVTCFLFTAFTLVYLERYGLRRSLISSFLIVMALYAVFNFLIGVPLPKGFLGI